ncbi:MAG: VIT family protein [Lysobacteraceae bacterium]
MIDHVHRTHRSGWLRAAVLGGNDGVLSMAGLLLGVAAGHGGSFGILLAGVAGALSMAAGEYVSVCSQADIERADLDMERQALQNDHANEQAELRDIYIQRGLDHALATQVAQQLMAHDALGAHARDDIGITDALAARPMQASMSSLLSFAVGGSIPLLAGVFSPDALVIPMIAVISFAALALLGALSAKAGGAPLGRAMRRILVWGVLAMILNVAIGALIGARPSA